MHNDDQATRIQKLAKLLRFTNLSEQSWECGCLEICHTITRIMELIEKDDFEKNAQAIEEEKNLLEEQKEEYYKHLEDKFEDLKSQSNDLFIFHNKIKSLI